MESLREQTGQDILNRLLLHISLLLLFFLDDVLILTKDHLRVVVPLLKGSLQIRVISVWILPEFPREVTSFSQPVVSNKLFLEEDWIDFHFETVIGIDVEILG